MATTTKSKPKKFTVEQYKELLKGEKKEITIELPISALSGSLDTFVKRVKAAVDNSEIEGSYTLSFADQVYGGYAGYGRPRRNSKPKRVVIKGSRPYTDAEFEVLGPKLVATKAARDAKAAKQRAANVAKFNALAEKLGVEALDA